MYEIFNEQKYYLNFFSATFNSLVLLFLVNQSTLHILDYRSMKIHSKLMG